MRSVGWCFVVYSGWIVGVAAVMASGGLWAEDLRGRTRSLETGGLRRGAAARSGGCFQWLSSAVVDEVSGVCIGAVSGRRICADGWR